MMLALLLLAIVSITTVNAYNPVSMQVDYLRIDGEKHDPYSDTNQVLEVRRGQTLPIKLKLVALQDVEDVQVSAKIAGYQYSDYEQSKIFDMSDTFDLDENRVEYKELELQVPMKVETGDAKLRISVEDKNSNGYLKEYNLDIEGTEDEGAVVIKDATLSPSNTVEPGHALSSLVKVENVGEKDLDDVTLTVSIPQLDIRDVETLDDLEVDEKEAFEQLLLRFPQDTEKGTYRVDYLVRFDEYESTSVSDMITVTEGSESEEQEEDPIETTVITMPEDQQLPLSASQAVYPITINNNGENDKTYSLSVTGVDGWGSARIEPSSSFSISSKNSDSATLTVTPDEDIQPGQKTFTLTAQVEGQQKTIPLSLLISDSDNVDSGDDDGLVDTVEIILIALVVALIVLAILFGIKKLNEQKGDDEDDDDDARTYY